MSDKGDIFYHPDLHTHESCLSEVSNCQLFILIIGGRFGGKYKVDPTKSITNAEYNAARETGIPVFTFVKEGVIADHHVYQKNKGKKFASEIDYPSIEHQEYAENIFTFIDTVRGADVNNGFFGFKYARDLHECLRKQWAGMFFEFLSHRSVSNQLKSTNESIANLSVASKKIEALIKNVYRQVDEVGANSFIDIIDAESEASMFFITVGKRINNENFVPMLSENTLGEVPPTNWWEFLIKLDGFEYKKNVFVDDGRKISMIIYRPTNNIVAILDGELSENERKVVSKLSHSYQAFKGLPKESRIKILQKFDEIPF